jgi:lipid-binding SYLF domain-containing protein
MFRSYIATIFALCIAASPLAAHAQAPQQALVDRSTLAAQDMLNDVDGRDAQSLLRHARATMICPQVFHAGFLFGGSGGDCVLVARDGAGSWSSPAFYGLGSASFGFQAGLQDSEIMMMILTDRGLRAIMDDQFTLGANAGAVFVQWGGGVQGATTGAVGADIVAFTRSRGLFAGISLSGSVLSTRSGWNRAYYGKEEAAQQIVISMDANNPGANPLREVLGRFGSSVTANPRMIPMASNDPGQQYAPPQPLAPVQSQPLSPVQSQSLPPPPPRY